MAANASRERGPRGFVNARTMHARRQSRTRSAPHAWPARGAVHVWSASLARSDAEVAHLAGTLSQDERMRVGRLHAPRDRRHFIVARGVLRALLGGYLGLPPAALGFIYASAGKPEVAHDHGPEKLRFNVAHSDGNALYAISAGHRVGVDIEVVRPLVDMEGVSRLVFSERERQELWALPPALRQRAFFDGWTRKEAVLKACGHGLNADLQRTEVSMVGREGSLLRTLEGNPRVRTEWTLVRVEMGQDLAAAVAVEAPHARVEPWPRPVPAYGLRVGRSGQDAEYVQRL